ncbi:MAG: hypothetical protein INF91_10345, partial [Alphaproteobacteria bacterium]|nr:hypothetical protein [Alphaproteobacteria bacterium]
MGAVGILGGLGLGVVAGWAAAGGALLAGRTMVWAAPALTIAVEIALPLAAAIWLASRPVPRKALAGPLLGVLGFGLGVATAVAALVVLATPITWAQGPRIAAVIASPV